MNIVEQLLKTIREFDGEFNEYEDTEGDDLFLPEVERYGKLKASGIWALYGVPIDNDCYADAEVHYDAMVYGKYRRATYYEPAEYPELELSNESVNSFRLYNYNGAMIVEYIAKDSYEARKIRYEKNKGNIYWSLSLNRPFPANLTDAADGGYFLTGTIDGQYLNYVKERILAAWSNDEEEIRDSENDLTKE